MQHVQFSLRSLMLSTTVIAVGVGAITLFPYIAISFLAVGLAVAVATAAANICRRMQWPHVDAIGFGLSVYACTAAVTAELVLHFGGGFYSPAFPAFVLLLWTGIFASVSALFLGSVSLLKKRHLRALVNIALPASLYLAWAIYIAFLIFEST